MVILLGCAVIGFIIGMNFCEIFGVTLPPHENFFRLITIIDFSAAGGFTGWLIAKIIGRFLTTEYRRARGIKLDAFGEPGDGKKFFLDVNYGKNEYVYYLNEINGSKPGSIPYGKAVINEYEKSVRPELNDEGWRVLYQKKFVNPLHRLIAFVSAKNEFKYEFFIPQGSIRRFTFKL